MLTQPQQRNHMILKIWNSFFNHAVILHWISLQSDCYSSNIWDIEILRLLDLWKSSRISPFLFWSNIRLNIWYSSIAFIDPLLNVEQATHITDWKIHFDKQRNFTWNYIRLWNHVDPFTKCPKTLSVSSEQFYGQFESGSKWPQSLP